MAVEMFHFAEGMAEAGVQIEHSAEAMGMSTKEMQQWQLAARMTGVSTGLLDTSFRILARNVNKPKAAAELAKLGIHVKDANGQVRPMADLFEEAGGAIGTMENASKRAAIGQMLFGRGFVRLLPLLSQGKDGMRAMRMELDKLGGGFDEDFIKKSKEVEKDSARLNQVWTSVKVTVAAYLLPALTWLLQKGKEVGLWFMEMSERTEMVNAGLIALGIAGAAALAPLLPAFGSLLLTVLPLVVAFLLIEDFLVFLQGGKSAFGDAIESMFGQGSAEKTHQWFLGVHQDLKNQQSDWNDLKMAVQLAWDGMGWVVERQEVMWSDALKRTKSGWSKLWEAMTPSDALLHTLKEIGLALLPPDAILEAFKKLFAFIKTASLEVATAMGEAFVKGWGLAFEAVKKLLDLWDKTGLSNLNLGKRWEEELAKTVLAHHAPGTAEIALDAETAQKRAARLAEYDAAHGIPTTSEDYGTGTGTRQPDINVQVTVPPGTDPNVVNDAKRGAEAGAKKGAETLRSVQAATKKGGG